MFFSYPVMAIIAVLFFIAFVVVWRRRGTLNGIRNWALLIPTAAWGGAALLSEGCLSGVGVRQQKPLLFFRP